MGQSTRQSSIGRAWAIGIVTCACLLLASTAHAQSREDGAPAESLGVGDTTRANAWGGGAIYLNPAALMRVNVLVVETAYSYLDGKDGHNFGLSVVDAKTNPDLALGTAYNYFTTAPGGVDRDGSQFRLALATGYRSDDVHLYAGIGVRWLDLAIGRDDDDDGVTENNDINSWTADAGLLLEFDRKIRFAVVGQNLIDTKTSEAPRILGLGMAFVFGTLDVSANLDMDISSESSRVVSTWGLGADLTVLEAAHLRAGFIRDEVYDAERMAFGLGWTSTDVAIDLGYATNIADPTEMTFAVSIRYVP